MAKVGADHEHSGHGAVLRFERFQGLVAELRSFRLDDVLREMEKYKERGRILGFVRGLRLSARLISILREALADTGVDVSWGHLLDAEERSCSPECDVILHRGGVVRTWNGERNSIMEFKFVSCRNAVAVVSCKSLLTEVDTEYCQQMREYVRDVFLFAECCRPKDLKRLHDNATRAGYSGLWYLYALEEGASEHVVDQRLWRSLLDALQKVASRRRSRR